MFQAWETRAGHPSHEQASGAGMEGKQPGAPTSLQNFTSQNCWLDFTWWTVSNECYTPVLARSDLLLVRTCKNHRFSNIAFSCIFLNSRCSTKNLFRQAAAKCSLYHSIHFQLALGGQEAESGWGVDLWDLNFSLGRNQSWSKREIGFHVDFIGFQRCQLQIQIVKVEFTPRSMCVMTDDK